MTTTIRYPTIHGNSILVELGDMDDWETFTDANMNVLLEQYGSIAAAYKHAIDGGLILGGGAAPEVYVYFTP